MLSILFGNGIYDGVNRFLLSNNFPCLGLISFLVIFVTPFAMLYGAHIRRFFWQRENHFNLVILLTSFLIGVIVSLLPIDFAFTMSRNTDVNCNPIMSLNATLIHTLGTALISTLLAVLGMDFGVVLKHVSRHIGKKRLGKKKTKTTRVHRFR